MPEGRAKSALAPIRRPPSRGGPLHRSAPTLFSLDRARPVSLLARQKRNGGCIRPAISMAESPSHGDGHIIRNKRGNINGQTIWNRRHPRRGGGEPHCRHGLPRGAGRGHCSDGGQGQPPHRGDRQGHPHLLRHAGVRPDGGALLRGQRREAGGHHSHPGGGLSHRAGKGGRGHRDLRQSQPL